MIEQAFRVTPGSDFAQNYFRSLSERKKFASLADAFFKNHNLNPVKYGLLGGLRMSMDDKERKEFESQLRKDLDENGLAVFKKKSPMQKAWEEEVVSRIDFDAKDCIKFWWFSYITRGSYALWDHNGEIYGLLTDKSANEIKLTDDMIPIKMSEYYAVMEEANEAYA